MGILVSIEGVCCSGKTTFARRLEACLHIRSFYPLYNHGAMTYTPLGREFYEVVSSGSKNFGVGVLYYMVDLLVNFRECITPYLNANTRNVVLQDRYIDSITTYASAYGKYFCEDCNIYRLSEVFEVYGMLCKPYLQIYCFPPYDVLIKRMSCSKSSPVHDLYRKHPKLLSLVYDELRVVAASQKGAIIVDTSSDKSVSEGIDNILCELESHVVR